MTPDGPMKWPMTRQMKEWSELADAMAYHKAEGFEVGQSRCLLCDQSMWCSHPPGTDTRQLECLYCGGHQSEFIECNP
jgi:hypothetical protein